MLNGKMRSLVFGFIAALQFASGHDRIIWKCCLKHEELHSNGRDCIVRSADRNDVPFAHAVQDSDTNRDILSSLPVPFNATDFRVRYSDVSTCQFNNFLLLDLNETHRFSVSNTTLQVNFTSFSGGTFVKSFDTDRYCLDSIQSKNDSLVIRVCTKNMSHAKKCCPSGELMQNNTDGNLECTNSKHNWTLQNSIFKKYIIGNTTEDFLDNVFSLCRPENFNIISDDYLKQNNLTHPHIFENSSSSTFLKYEFVCVDYYRENRKGMRKGDPIEKLGRCYRSDEYLTSFFEVHHLCLAAAFLLVLSIIAIMIRAELRKSLHGQALACHVLALLMASILRAIWWYSQLYKPAKISECNTLASILNYYMVASALWLNIICINTVIEIRNSQDSGKAHDPLSMVWYSLYGWGFPVIHTLLVVLHPWQLNHNSPTKTHIFHTRTCFFKDDLTGHHKMEKFLFYYGPMTGILIVNIGLLIYSVTKCKQLQSSVTAMLGGSRKIRPLSTKTVPEQALMYARLLISAGVGEMAAEIMAWALNDPVQHGPDGSRLAEKKVIKLEVGEKEVTFWILATAFDFLRALSVFFLCVVSRSTVRAVKHIYRGYSRLGRTPTAALSRFSFRGSRNNETQDDILMSPLP